MKCRASVIVLLYRRALRGYPAREGISSLVWADKTWNFRTVLLAMIVLMILATEPLRSWRVAGRVGLLGPVVQCLAALCAHDVGARRRPGRRALRRASRSQARVAGGQTYIVRDFGPKQSEWSAPACTAGRGEAARAGSYIPTKPKVVALQTVLPRRAPPRPAQCYPRLPL